MFQQTWAMSYVAILETLGDSSLTLKEKQYVTDKIRNMALNHLPRKNYDIITRENILVMLPPDKELYECEGNCIVETGKNIAKKYVRQVNQKTYDECLLPHLRRTKGTIASTFTYFFFGAGTSGSMASNKRAKKALSSICSAVMRSMGFAPS